MTAFGYLRDRLGEFLLVLLCSWAVASVAMNGFFLDGIMEQAGYGARLGMCLGVCLVLCLMLYFAAGMKSRVAGTVLFAVVAALLVVAALGASAGEAVYADEEGNYLYFVLVPLVSCAACFLLSRTLAGSMAWFVAASFSCSVIQAFYQSGELVLSVVAAIGSVALVVYRNFSIGVRGAQLKDGSASRMALPVSVAPAIITAGIALVMWFVVIAPLSPGVLDVKLITEYFRLPIEEYVGTAQEQPVINYDMTSDNLVDGEFYTTDDLQIDSESSVVVEATSIAEQLEAMGIQGTGSGSSSGGGTRTEFDEQDEDQNFDPFSYTQDISFVLLWILAILAIIALVALLFMLRRRRRMDRLVGYLNQDPNSQIVLLYRFIYERLRRIGFPQPEGMTLREFASSSSRSMDMLTEEVGVSFQALTETYIACVYGDYEPTEDDVVPFVSYYLRFWKAARAYLGNFRYFFKSFRL